MGEPTCNCKPWLTSDKRVVHSSSCPLNRTHAHLPVAIPNDHPVTLGATLLCPHCAGVLAIKVEVSRG